MKRQWLWLVALVISSVQAAEIEISPVPSWVVEQSFEAQAQRKDRVDGSIYMLVSNQFNALSNTPTFYSRYVTQAVNSEGVESNSQIAIDFDPSYEEVVLHNVKVWREGKPLERLSSIDVKRFKREVDLEKLLYSGQETFYIVINDVQEGDIIDYSYSIKGLNPVFNGKVDRWIKMGWSVPVLKTYARVLTPKDSQYTVNRYGDSRHLKAEINQDGKIVEHIYSDERRSYSYLNEADQPDWFIEYPYININNYENWADVVSWALPHYQIDVQGSKFAAEVSKLKAIEDPERQVIAAIKLAQQSIRYLGIENGIGSHAPRQPEQTLQQGYGDCKDKSVLLTAMLRELGIEANPALVSTVYRKHLAGQPSGHSAFNHVIVTFYFQGKTFWIDPTQTELSDSLATMTQSELGYGLIIKQGEIYPTLIDTNNLNQVETTSTFKVASHENGASTLHVETTYKGKQADRMRRYLSANSIEQVMDEFEGFYNKHYEGISASKKFYYFDDLMKNELYMTENYDIEKMWYLNEDDDPQFEVYADVIGANVYVSEAKRRSTPFYIGRPVKVAQTMVIELPSPWKITPDELKVNNEAFDFSLSLNGEEGNWLSKVSGEYRQARIHYQLERKQPDVMPNALKEYNQQIERASESVVYQFTRYE